MSNKHKDWLVQEQTALGKDFSNPFMADNLPKILTMFHVQRVEMVINVPWFFNQTLATPELMANWEAVKSIQDCNKCKEQPAIWKAGVDGAIAVGSTWLFSYLGIHILGPLPMAPGGLQFLQSQLNTLQNGWKPNP
ncbi:hypothetical protein Tco_0643645 [Tanacetum coccineum]